jgi:hypothetical protein
MFVAVGSTSGICSLILGGYDCARSALSHLLDSPSSDDGDVPVVLRKSQVSDLRSRCFKSKASWFVSMAFKTSGKSGKLTLIVSLQPCQPRMLTAKRAALLLLFMRTIATGTLVGAWAWYQYSARCLCRLRLDLSGLASALCSS